MVERIHLFIRIYFLVRLLLILEQGREQRSEFKKQTLAKKRIFSCKEGGMLLKTNSNNRQSVYFQNINGRINEAFE